MSNFKDCPFCGRTVANNSKVCKHCGKRLNHTGLPKINLPIIKITVIALIVIVIWSLIKGISDTSENYSENVEQLIEYATGQHKAKESVDLYYSLSYEEKNAFVKYFDKHPEKFPPVWFFITADQVFAHDKDKAVLYVYIGKLRVTQDVMLCEDISARNGQPSAYYKTAPKTMVYSQLKQTDNKYINDILQKSLDWDKSHPGRVNPIWACGHGIKAMYEEPKLIDESEFSTVREKVRNIVKESINKHKTNE